MSYVGMVDRDNVCFVFARARHIQVLAHETARLDSHVELRVILAFLEVAGDDIVTRSWYFLPGNQILTQGITDGILVEMITFVQTWIPRCIRKRTHIPRFLHLLDIFIVPLGGISRLYYLERGNGVDGVLLVVRGAWVAVVGQWLLLKRAAEHGFSKLHLILHFFHVVVGCWTWEHCLLKLFGLFDFGEILRETV